MGNVEKWVVLGVLALIVGILVVSLNVDDPLKKDKVVLAGASDTPTVASADRAKPEAPKSDPAAAPSPRPETGPAPAAALLNSSVDTSARSTTAAPAGAIPQGSILKTMDGLQESYMSDACFYTWKSGDTFPTLAQRFYGDASRLATLKRLNEGRADVQPGERILVPIFDLDAVQAPAIASAAAPKSDLPKKPDAAPAATASPAAAPASAAGARFHVVKDGESLWKIAKQELGSGARWNEIYTANRDVLPSPEALHTGQKLRVP
jgi:nucleoid-associated protein YgaU